MIDQDDLIAIGRITRTHGVNGEMSVSSPGGELPEWDDLRCVFLMMDGIPVPFFISGWRPKSSESDLISLDGVTTEKEASELCGKTVYINRQDLPAQDETDFDEGFYADDLVGFTVESDDGRLHGKIKALESSTANFLFIIETDSGEEVLVPAAAEFIADVDSGNRVVKLSLPEGLLD